jgi:hypothetical protein
VQICKLMLEHGVHMTVAGDIAGSPGARADRAQCLLYRREDRGVLSHAEIIVRAPHRHLSADAVTIGARKAAAAPLEIGEDAIPSLGAQRVKTLFEEAFVIHCDCTPRITVAATILKANLETRRGRPFVDR